MKTRITLAITALIMPLLSSGQWSQVRYDQVNNFMKGFAITPSSLMVTGMDQNFTGSFMLRSNNAGLTWDSIVLSTTESYQLGALYFIDLNTGFAGGFKNGKQVLLNTNDNGLTWNEITPDTTSGLQIVAISFPDAMNGYAATQNTIYKTNDGGNTWTTISMVQNVSDIYFTDANTGYAGCGAGPQAIIKRTTDGGATWTTLFAATVPFLSQSAANNLDVLSNDISYSSLLYTNRLIRTTDQGLSWDTIAILQIYEVLDFDFISVSEGHVLSSMGEIYHTVDGGNTWVLDYSVAGGAYGPSVFLSSITFAENEGYVCGSNGLIKKFTPGVTFTEEAGTSAMMSLYPNPISASGILNFNDDAEVVEFYNISGKLVTRTQVDNNMLSLADVNLKTGIYSVKILSDSKVLQGRIVIVD